MSAESRQAIYKIMIQVEKKNTLEKYLSAQIVVELLQNLQLYVQNAGLKLLGEVPFLQSRNLKKS